MGAVLGLLREGVREPGEPAHRHTHGEVLALGIAGADVRFLRPAFDAGLGGTGANTGAVAASAGNVAVMLDQHGVVDVGTKRALYGLQVGLVAVSGKLHAVRQPRRHVLHKLVRVAGIPAADEIGDDQLAVGVQVQTSSASSGAALAVATFFCLA